MAMLAFGSSFWHASHTRLAGDMDEKGILMVLYAAYAGATDNLNGSSVLKELSSEPKEAKPFDMIENTVIALKDKPVNEW